MRLAQEVHDVVGHGLAVIAHAGRGRPARAGPRPGRRPGGAGGDPRDEPRGAGRAARRGRACCSTAPPRAAPRRRPGCPTCRRWWQRMPGRRSPDGSVGRRWGSVPSRGGWRGVPHRPGGTDQRAAPRRTPGLGPGQRAARRPDGLGWSRRSTTPARSGPLARTGRGHRRHARPRARGCGGTLAAGPDAPVAASRVAGVAATADVAGAATRDPRRGRRRSGPGPDGPAHAGRRRARHRRLSARRPTAARRSRSSVRTCPPDVVLLDIRMPVLDGLAALRQITADPALAAVRVVMLTTSSWTSTSSPRYATAPAGSCSRTPSRRSCCARYGWSPPASRCCRRR